MGFWTPLFLGSTGLTAFYNRKAIGDSANDWIHNKETRAKFWESSSEAIENSGGLVNTVVDGVDKTGDTVVAIKDTTVGAYEGAKGLANAGASLAKGDIAGALEGFTKAAGDNEKDSSWFSFKNAGKVAGATGAAWLGWKFLSYILSSVFGGNESSTGKDSNSGGLISPTLVLGVGAAALAYFNKDTIMNKLGFDGDNKNTQTAAVDMNAPVLM